MHRCIDRETLEQEHLRLVGRSHRGPQRFECRHFGRGKAQAADLPPKLLRVEEELGADFFCVRHRCRRHRAFFAGPLQALRGFAEPFFFGWCQQRATDEPQNLPPGSKEREPGASHKQTFSDDSVRRTVAASSRDISSYLRAEHHKHAT